MKAINQNLHHINWPASNVLAFTTTRHHPDNKTPCSIVKLAQLNPQQRLAPYDHFNLGLHVGDNKHRVEQNRQSLMNFVPKNCQLQWLDQVHGGDVVNVKHYSQQPLVADAAISQDKNIALAIMTADCLPILLAAKNGSEVAAIHGGWRPLATNIIVNTVNAMTTDNKNIIAWLGPCIGPEAFEVGQDVRDVFINLSGQYKSAFSAKTTEQSENKFFADLAFIAKVQLQALGITDIYHLKHCTFDMADDYFSFRRTGITGRMASVISRL